MLLFHFRYGTSRNSFRFPIECPCRVARCLSLVIDEESPRKQRKKKRKIYSVLDQHIAVTVAKQRTCRLSPGASTLHTVAASQQVEHLLEYESGPLLQERQRFLLSESQCEACWNNSFPPNSVDNILENNKYSTSDAVWIKNSYVTISLDRSTKAAINKIF